MVEKEEVEENEEGEEKTRDRIVGVFVVGVACVKDDDDAAAAAAAAAAILRALACARIPTQSTEPSSRV